MNYMRLGSNGGIVLIILRIEYHQNNWGFRYSHYALTYPNITTLRTTHSISRKNSYPVGARRFFAI